MKIRQLKFRVLFIIGALVVLMYTASVPARADIVSNLVAYWDFDEGSGTDVADVTGNGYDGTFGAGVSWTSGISGDALDFDGTQGLVTITTSTSMIASGEAYTISAWVQFDDPGKSGGNMIFNHNVAGSEALAFRQSTTGLRVQDGTVAGLTDDLDFRTFDTNWSHVVAVSDGSEHKIYVNGEDIGTRTIGGSIGPQSGMYIGARNAAGVFLDGRIDEVRVYNRALDAHSVRALYELDSGETLTVPSAPSFSAPSGTYAGPFNLSITSDDTIYYRLDGEAPDRTDSAYSGVIQIEDTATVTAIAFNGTYGSTTQAYYVVASTTSGGISSEAGPDAVLPQDESYMRTLRNWMATLSESDFDVTLADLVWDEAYASTTEEAFELAVILDNRATEVSSTNGLRRSSAHFTLDAIESDDQINLSPNDATPAATAWWATWDYEGSPFRPGTANATALLKRALVGAIVDMIMIDDRYSLDTARSDLMGAALIHAAYVYQHAKDLMPSEVQLAYEAGLRRVFDKIVENNPFGTGGGNMETIHLIGLWYAAEVLDDDDLRSQWSQRVDLVIDRMFVVAGGAAHEHGYSSGATDTSYEGIALYYLAWLGGLSGDQRIVDLIADTVDLQSHLIFVDPDGDYTGPSNWNTGTRMGSDQMQYQWAYRDVILGQLTENARYLKYMTDTNRWIIDGSLVGLDDLHATIETAINRANSSSLLTGQELTSDPSVWNYQAFLRINYARDLMSANTHARISSDELHDYDLKKPVTQQTADYIKAFGDDFLAFGFDGFGGVIHSGEVRGSWADNVSGLSGGSLSTFWTPQTGTVIQGRNRGSQNGADADAWSGANGPLVWSVHAVTGLTSGGSYFSSARITDPDTTITTSGATSALVSVAGTLGDDAITDPDEALVGTIAYERTFDITRSGVHVTTELVPSRTDEGIQELWEILPLYSYDSRHQTASEAISVAFKVNNEWQAATSELTEAVSEVRLTRFDKDVYVDFEVPVRAKISNTTWEISDKIMKNLYVDLSEGGNVVPVSGSLSYVISPFEDGYFDPSPPAVGSPASAGPRDSYRPEGVNQALTSDAREQAIDTADADNSTTRTDMNQSPADPAGATAVLSEEEAASVSCVVGRGLQLGSVGGDVACLQWFLLEQGYYDFEGGVTGVYGPVTEAAVRAWQAESGLTADGIFGIRSLLAWRSVSISTQEMGECTFRRLLARGSVGEDVSCLQTYLVTEGFYDESYGVDGLFGDQTEQSVRLWQAEHGLETDGIFGTLSRQRYQALTQAR